MRRSSASTADGIWSTDSSGDGPTGDRPSGDRPIGQCSQAKASDPDPSWTDHIWNIKELLSVAKNDRDAIRSSAISTCAGQLRR